MLRQKWRFSLFDIYEIINYDVLGKYKFTDRISSEMKCNDT